MDKRKLIGTIIGVMMFAALIVGATYAWLSFAANVTSTGENTSASSGSTLTYWVDYDGGTGISQLPILETPTTSTAAVATITAKRPQYSIANNIKIYLTTTSNTSLTKSGTIKYVICENSCNSTFSGNTIRSVTEASTVEIFSGTLSGTANSSSNPTHTYKVYFWLDAATLINEHLGQTYSGYLHADSAQDTTTYG